MSVVSMPQAPSKDMFPQTQNTESAENKQKLGVLMSAILPPLMLSTGFGLSVLCPGDYCFVSVPQQRIMNVSRSL